MAKIQLSPSVLTPQGQELLMAYSHLGKSQVLAGTKFVIITLRIIRIKRIKLIQGSFFNPEKK